MSRMSQISNSSPTGVRPRDYANIIPSLPLSLVSVTKIIKIIQRLLKLAAERRGAFARLHVNLKKKITINDVTMERDDDGPIVKWTTRLRDSRMYGRLINTGGIVSRRNVLARARARFPLIDFPRIYRVASCHCQRCRHCRGFIGGLDRPIAASPY